MKKLEVLFGTARFYSAYALFLGLFLESLWTITIAVLAEMLTLWFYHRIIIPRSRPKTAVIERVEFSPEEFRRVFMISHNDH